MHLVKKKKQVLNGRFKLDYFCSVWNSSVVFIIISKYQISKQKSKLFENLYAECNSSGFNLPARGWKAANKEELKIYTVSRYKYLLIYKIFYFLHLPCLFLGGEVSLLDQTCWNCITCSIVFWNLLRGRYQEINLNSERSIFRCKHLSHGGDD